MPGLQWGNAQWGSGEWADVGEVVLSANLNAQGVLTFAYTPSLPTSLAGAGLLTISNFTDLIAALAGRGILTLTIYGAYKIGSYTLNLYSGAIRVQMPICFLPSKNVYSVQHTNESDDFPQNDVTAIDPQFNQ